jgi:hypothetical protein
MWTLFLCKLSSRRQLDCQLNTDGPEVLANLNRLASTAQDSRPANQTLEYLSAAEKMAKTENLSVLYHGGILLA